MKCRLKAISLVYVEFQFQSRVSLPASHLLLKLLQQHSVGADDLLRGHQLLAELGHLGLSGLQELLLLQLRLEELLEEQLVLLQLGPACRTRALMLTDAHRKQPPFLNEWCYFGMVLLCYLTEEINKLRPYRSQLYVRTVRIRTCASLKCSIAF